MMRRLIGVVGVLALVVGALVATMPASARVTPAFDLQMSVDGRAGMAAPTIKCERSRDRCFISNKSGCTKAC